MEHSYMRAFIGIVLVLSSGVALAGPPVTDSNGHQVKDRNGRVVTSSNPKSAGWTADSGSVTVDSSKTADGGKLKSKPRCAGWTADSSKVTADSSCTADGGKPAK